MWIRYIIFVLIYTQISNLENRVTVCLFGFFLFFVLLENFSLIWRRHHGRWGAANFDPYSALMTMKQWRFFNVQRLLWHGTSVSKGHLWGPMTTHTYCLAYSSGVVTTYFNDVDYVAARIQTPNLPHARRTLL